MNLKPPSLLLLLLASSWLQADAAAKFGRQIVEPANNEKPFASMLNSAVINGKVSLACDISPASSDDSVALILWYKDDSLAPIYTIDARKASSLDRAKMSFDEAYANRASFNMKSKPAQLHLEPIRQEDEGDYRCRVDFKRGRTVNTIISLRVVSLPDEIRIVTPQRPHTKLEGLIGPFNEGSELILVCLAQGGKPRPQISWRRDFNVIDETYQHVDKDGTSNELKIPALNKNHLLSIFTCQASNNNLTSPMQTSITLDLYLKPQEVSLKLLGQEPLIVGQTSTFECLTHGSRPQATIHWLFQGIRHDTPMNGEYISIGRSFGSLSIPSIDLLTVPSINRNVLSNTTTVDQQQTSSRLTLTLQRTFNQQTLTCVAENPRIGQSSAIRQTIKLDVHYPPQLSIRLETQSAATASVTPSDVGVAQTGALVGNLIEHSALERDLVAHLQEGNDIYLTCQMDANPRPLKPILWRFNGKPLAQLAQQQQLLQQQQQQQQASNMIVMNNQSLVLRKVSRQQSGSYTCDASNLHGSNTSKPLELLIRHAPVCATDDLLTFQAAIGQTVTLDCNVRANPAKSVQYSWFIAPEETNLTSWFQREAGLDEQVDESSSRLRLKIKDQSSFGLIKCKAKNEVGLQQRACIYQVQATPPPSLRHDCTLQNATAISAQIECHPNEHLKSEEFELVGGRKDNLGADGRTNQVNNPIGINQQQQMGSWLNFDLINRQAGHTPAESPTIGALPIARLVYPPNWLLAELYKQTGDGPSDKSHELLAYVVVGSSQRLANIKSIVEDSRVFSANPKKVYYVAAKPVMAIERAGKTGDLQESSTMLANMTTHRSDNSSKDIEQEDSFVSSSIQHWPNFARNSREDPSIQLPTAFVFNVPSLEPASKYRLHIYGQNLANRTSDWLPVKVETMPDSEPLESKNQRHLQGANLLASRSSSSSSTSDQSDESGSSQQQQKSIVMRSDSDPSGVNDQQSDGSGIEVQQQDQYPRSLYQLSSALGLGDRLQQIGLYKSNIITYAKQRPLMAGLMALVSGLVMVLVFAWTSNRLIHLILPAKSGSNRRRQLNSLVQETGDERHNDNGSNSSSNGGDNKQQQAENELLDDIKLIKANGRQPQQSSPDDNWSCGGQQDSHNHQLIVGNNSLQLMKHSIDSSIGKTSGVYSIQEGLMRDSHLQGPNHYVTQEQLVNQLHAARVAASQPMAPGSLDRRDLSNQQQQIYQLAANGTLLELCKQDHLAQERCASVDRSKIAFSAESDGGDYGHHQLLVSAADLVDQLAGEGIPTSQSHEIYLQGLPGELAMCNHDGSFSTSSVDCNSSVDHQHLASQQLHQLQQQQFGHYGYTVSSSGSSAGTGTNLNFRQQPRSRQKVVFNLGNQTMSQSRHLCTTGRVASVNGLRKCDTYAGSSSPNESSSLVRQRVNSNRDKRNGPATGKGSDSGGSNSGATADSGHDSPATGETTASACSNGQLQHHQNCPTKMNSTLGRLANATSPRLSPIGMNGWPLSSSHGTTTDNRNSNSSDNGNTNQVMLMELSPGSQESSTLLQSVESYGSEQQQAQICPILGQLQNNHQMATSFTSSMQTNNNHLNATSPDDPSHWL